MSLKNRFSFLLYLVLLTAPTTIFNFERNFFCSFSFKLAAIRIFQLYKDAHSWFEPAGKHQINQQYFLCVHLPVKHNNVTSLCWSFFFF